jgi:hypothetical protein
MINASDVGYHTPKDVNYDWAETMYFSIYIPEANITAWVYVVARAGVGAMVVDIEVFDCVARTTIEARYFDFQQHLPIPESFQNFTLPNGLTLSTSNEPNDYRIVYKGTDDTEFDWKITGLMAPFDINDPNIDPLATGDASQSGFGAAYANHFDMTVHIEGSATIRGKRYAVDCVTTMDHSWGPRNERGMNPMGWINGNFGKDLAFSSIWKLDQFKQGWQQFELAHGYVLRDGAVKGLVKGRMRAIGRQGAFPTGYETVLIDLNGDEYYFTGSTVTQTPWACYSNIMAINSTIKWYNGAENREGVGAAQENWPLDRLTGKGLV